jgi:hypothetical protein
MVEIPLHLQGPRRARSRRPELQTRDAFPRKGYRQRSMDAAYCKNLPCNAASVDDHKTSNDERFCEEWRVQNFPGNLFHSETMFLSHTSVAPH